MDDMKTRTITLTGRAPVRIVEGDWPIIARAAGDAGRMLDGARHDQALARGELDRYWLTVRQHADGRAIVYGRLDAGWTATESCVGGRLLPAGADIAEALAQVGDACGVPAAVIREAIADLPAEVL